MKLIKTLIEIFLPNRKKIFISTLVCLIGQGLYYTLDSVMSLTYGKGLGHFRFQISKIQEIMSIILLGPTWIAFETHQKIIMALHSWLMIYFVVAVIISNIKRLKNNSAKKTRIIVTSIMLYILCYIMIMIFPFRGLSTQIRLAEAPKIRDWNIIVIPRKNNCGSPFRVNCTDCYGLKIWSLCIGKEKFRQDMGIY